MSIILHDKSRLAEISPLVSPGIYPTVKVEIEWGWSHPDTNEFTSNPYAKFLNALRNKQIYTIVSTSFSNRDTSTLSIKLQLMGIGEQVASNTSIYTGNYVQYELIRARMNQLFTIIDVKAKDGQPAKQSFAGVRETEISLSNWETSDKWVPYERYESIDNLIDKAAGDPTSIDALIKSYGEVLAAATTSTNSAALTAGATGDPVPSNLLATLQETAREALLTARIETSPYVKNVYGTDDTGSLSSHMKSIVSDMLADAGAKTTTQELGSGGENTTESTVAHVITFGDVLFRFFSIPMSLTRIYDEIRVTTFDFNDHAGRMAGFNIGAFPILISDVALNLFKQKINVQKGAQKLISLVNNPAAVPYGMKQAYLLKAEAEKAAAESDEDDDTEVQATRDKIEQIFTEALKVIYADKTKLGLDVSFEDKFVPPRVKMHTEVTPVEDGTDERGGKKFKQVLNIFIYDDANTGYRSTNLLSSIIQQDSNIVRVFKAGKDLAGLEAAEQKKLQKTSVDGKELIVSMDRETAKKIITSMIPTLRIGTEGSLITNASYNSSPGGDLTNINLLQGIKNSGGASGTGTFPGIDADLFVIPASLSITMMGMPIINRGQTYFVDFGTGTTLDNTYTVMSVKHSMKLGSFTTSVVLNITNQGSIKSVASKLRTDAIYLKEWASKNLSTSPSG